MFWILLREAFDICPDRCGLHWYCCCIYGCVWIYYIHGRAYGIWCGDREAYRWQFALIAYEREREQNLCMSQWFVVCWSAGVRRGRLIETAVVFYSVLFSLTHIQQYLTIHFSSHLLFLSIIRIIIIANANTMQLLSCLRMTDPSISFHHE